MMGMIAVGRRGVNFLKHKPRPGPEANHARSKGSDRCISCAAGEKTDQGRRPYGCRPPPITTNTQLQPLPFDGRTGRRSFQALPLPDPLLNKPGPPSRFDAIAKRQRTGNACAVLAAAPED